MNNDQRVIAYVPKDSEERPASDMGAVRRGLWMYTHKLGLNFSLVLLLSLAYQAFVAIFIALKGLRNLPVFQGLMQGEQFALVIGSIAVVLVAVIIQGLIIAEMAQVVWLRHPDRLKVRLMSGSVWWWVMLLALLVSIGIDFLLLFLSVTEQTNLDAAFKFVARDQITGLTILLLSILNFLTLLRCASVMRTSTSEEIRREVEERLNAIAEEMLIDAGDSARAKAAKVWRKLSVNPQRFVPIHDSVLNLISQNHPNLVPPQIGGDTWAYDFSGNTFAALPPDVHMALLQNRYRASTKGGPAGNNNNRKMLPKFSTHDSREAEDNQYLWKLPPTGMAEMINFNLETYGKPKFVDITEPDSPRYLTRPLELSALGLTDELLTEALPPGIKNPIRALDTQQFPIIGNGRNNNQQTTQQYQTVYNVPTSEFMRTLGPKEKALFGAYLAKTVFPQLHGEQFIQIGGSDIYEVFDEIELQWYYRYWKKHFTEGSNPTHVPVPSPIGQ